MKKLTCKDFGGPCNNEITGNTFDEMGKNCKSHVIEQINNGDEAHKAAAAKMRNTLPEEQKLIFAEFEKRFNNAPNI